MNKLALQIDSWKSFAPFIGLSRQDEEDIEDEYKKNSEKKVAMLRTWKEKYGEEATYLRLAEAFETLKRRDLIVVLIDLSQSTSQTSSRGASSGQEEPRGKKKHPIPKLSDTPKPGQLLKLVGRSGKEIRIRDDLAGDWEALLMMFDFQPASNTGALIKRIKKDTGYQAEEACREVLLKWLSGAGKQPTNWETLINVIEDVGFGELASEIRSEILPA